MLAPNGLAAAPKRHLLHAIFKREVLIAGIHDVQGARLQSIYRSAHGASAWAAPLVRATLPKGTADEWFDPALARHAGELALAQLAGLRSP